MSEDTGAEPIGASPLPASTGSAAESPDSDATARTSTDAEDEGTAAAVPDTAAAEGSTEPARSAPDARDEDTSTVSETTTAAEAAGTAETGSEGAQDEVHSGTIAPGATPAEVGTGTAATVVDVTTPGRPSAPLLAGAAFTGLLLVATPFAATGGADVLFSGAASAQEPLSFAPWSAQGTGDAVGGTAAGANPGDPGTGFVPQPLVPVASEEAEDEEADGGGDGASGDGGGLSPRHPWVNPDPRASEAAAAEDGDGGEEEAQDGEDTGRPARNEDGQDGQDGQESDGGDDTVTAAAGDEDDAVVTLSGEEHAKILGDLDDGEGSEDSGGEGGGNGGGDSSDDSPVTTAAAENGSSGSSGSGGSGGSGNSGGSQGSNGFSGSSGPSGPAYSGITGPGCKSDDRTYFWAYNTWYDDPVNSWATRSSGYTKDGCDGLYQAIPVSGDRHNGSGPSTTWTFTPGWAGSHCEVWVYIPQDETPLWISNGPAKYMVNSGGSPGAPFTQAEIVQSNVKGTWTKIAEFDAPTEQFTVQLVNSGENKAAGQGTAHVASSPMRANCS